RLPRAPHCAAVSAHRGLAIALRTPRAFEWRRSGPRSETFHARRQPPLAPRPRPQPLLPDVRVHHDRTRPSEAPERRLRPDPPVRTLPVRATPGRAPAAVPRSLRAWWRSRGPPPVATGQGDRPQVCAARTARARE